MRWLGCHYLAEPYQMIPTPPPEASAWSDCRLVVFDFDGTSCFFQTSHKRAPVIVQTPTCGRGASGNPWRRSVMAVTR
jgi:hypothetical protein